MAEVNSPPKKKRRSKGNPQSEEEEDEGFKFSRKSRRTKINYYQGKRSDSKSAKKKRRSSFVPGRKQRKSLAPPTSQNSLHHNIPIGLPPTARLRMLFNKSLELAITKITEQPSSIIHDYPDFQEEAKTVFQHLQQVISETVIVDEASQSSDQEVVTIPNPMNQIQEERAVGCDRVNQSLKEEYSKCDELLQSYQQLEKNTKQELQEYVDSNKSKEECPDFLSPSQHRLLSGKPGYKSVLDKLENVKQHSQLQVDKICQVNSSLKNYKDFTESYVQQQTKSFGSKSLKVINDMGTPRTLIRGHFTGR